VNASEVYFVEIKFVALWFNTQVFYGCHLILAWSVFWSLSVRGLNLLVLQMETGDKKNARRRQ
jgi:hypothetical protein